MTIVSCHRGDLIFSRDGFGWDRSSGEECLKLFAPAIDNDIQEHLAVAWWCHANKLGSEVGARCRRTFGVAVKSTIHTTIVDLLTRQVSAVFYLSAADCGVTPAAVSRVNDGPPWVYDACFRALGTAVAGGTTAATVRANAPASNILLVDLFIIFCSPLAQTLQPATGGSSTLIPPRYR
jgi:hypothetical protein